MFKILKRKKQVQRAVIKVYWDIPYKCKVFGKSSNTQIQITRTVLKVQWDIHKNERSQQIKNSRFKKHFLKVNWDIYKNEKSSKKSENTHSNSSFES